MVSLDDLNDFVLLHIFEYLDVISLTRMQMISRHLFVAAYRVLSNSPSIITKSGISPRSFKSILDGLTSTPTFALVVGERMNQKLSNFVSALQTSLPKSTHVILAKCTGVLKCPIVPAETSSSGKSLRKRAVDEDNADSSTEPSSIGDYTVFMASLPDTQCSSFYVRVCESTAPAITDESLRAYGLQDVDQEWELFLVFASPTPFIGEFIAGLQLRYPRAVIVGGIYHQQIALFQYHQFRSESNSIACLALRGRVPVRAIVSRGHEAASPVYNLPSSKLNTVLDEQYNFLQVTGMTVAGRTEMMNPGSVMRDIITTHHGNADIYMIGSRYANLDSTQPEQQLQQQGFNLQLVTEEEWQPRSINFAVESRLPVPNQLRFFIVNGDTCARDMEQVMALAKKRFATDGQSVLGTVMFTCSGRGPHKHFFGRSDYDAQIYRGEFPNAPLLGCYVDGEIGPQLLGDVDREATLFASSSTQSSAQGYTAVFCLFAVPPRRSIPEMMASLQPLIAHTRAQIQRLQQHNHSFATDNSGIGTSCGGIHIASSGSTKSSTTDSGIIAATTTNTYTNTTSASITSNLALVQEEESAVVQAILRLQRARSTKSRSRSNSIASIGSIGSAGMS